MIQAQAVRVEKLGIARSSPGITAITSWHRTCSTKHGRAFRAHSARRQESTDANDRNGAQREANMRRNLLLIATGMVVAIAVLAALRATAWPFRGRRDADLGAAARARHAGGRQHRRRRRSGPKSRNPLLEDPFFRRFFEGPDAPLAPPRDAAPEHRLRRHHRCRRRPRRHEPSRDSRRRQHRRDAQRPPRVQRDARRQRRRHRRGFAARHRDRRRRLHRDSDRQLERARRRRLRRRDRQSVRARANGDGGHRERARPQRRQHRKLRGLHSDGCVDQSRQLGRRARRHQWPVARRQHGDLVRHRRQHRHRLRHSEQHGPRGRCATARARQRAARPHRHRDSGRDAGSRAGARAPTRTAAPS